MKKSIISLFLVLIALASFSQTWIRSDEARRFRGDVINMVGLVTEVTALSSDKHAGKYIRLAGKQPGTSLTLVIAKGDLHKFEFLSADLIHQYLHVKGKIFTKKGRPYIKLSSPSQVSIAREMELNPVEPL
jgi:hypothetical protein